ncbi:MAG: aminotransferase class III-fold pyridoxal phosphate-dependent enzyme, partial [Flavobacteriales bacterium]|nr:aminotransferase class III-fold pyridoxal phosphate-dependent enzyme [Flavobacteriales bacterium]
SIETEMAQEFLSLIPQHDMIKFAKNGSIVTTAAVKLARAKTGRDLVAFPGDHPFYSYDDWFIGQTACDIGIPKSTKELSVTFKSGDLGSLEALFDKYPNQIACIITEPEKNFDRENGIDPETFLKQAIDLCHKNGALFILDEMITGFKIDLPGAITKYNLNPDLATWGKSTANGFSFCALTGKREIMHLGGIDNPGQEKLFLISTTHGGETHGIGAGIATIQFYKENNVIEKNLATGKTIREGANKIIKSQSLEQFLSVSNTDWMLVFTFKDKNGSHSLELRTIFLQHMIENGVLFQGAFVPCFTHDLEATQLFLKVFESACTIFKQALETGHDKLLVGETVKPVFRKYI